MAHARRALVFTFILCAASILAGCNVTKPADRSDVTDLRAEQSDEGGIRLTWGESLKGTAKSFVVYRDGREIARVESPLRTYLDQDVQAERTYEYVVVGVDDQGRVTGAQSAPVSYTYREFLSFTQDESIHRGYVNLTVLARSPGMRWSNLDVGLSGHALPKSSSGFIVNGTWTHTNPRDELVDLGERLQILAEGLVRRNATLTVELDSGKVLFNAPLEGRPTINLTLRQDRNATGGRVSLTVTSVNWVDNGHVAQPSNPNLQPRWTDIQVFVNGRQLPYDELLRNHTWNHDNPTDKVIRPGTRMTLRTDPGTLTRDARVTIFDAGAQETASYVLLR